MGKSAEITRDEVKFYKFIQRLRFKFSALLTDILRKQVLLKGIMTENDWDDISQSLTYIFNEDSYFSEMRETEILKERIALLAQIEPYIGKYYSTDYARKTILKQSETQIKQIDIQNAAEKNMLELEQMQQMQNGEMAPVEDPQNQPQQ